MSYRVEKNGDDKDLVFEGWEKGVAPSPHKGVANLQNVNIATEESEVMCSYNRALQSQSGTSATSHTINPNDSNHLSTSFELTNGVWINISASTITGLSAGNYYIQNSNGNSSTAATAFQISQYYNGALVTGFGATGTATYTLIRGMGQPVAWAKEPYFTTTQQYRYYVLDSTGLVWVYDTARVDAGAVGKIYWFLPDTSVSYFGSDTAPSGIAILNGWLLVFSGNKIWVKETVNLGGTTSTSTLYVQMTNVLLTSKSNTTNPHYAFVGSQGRCYYTDGNYIGSIFPDTSLESGVANIQSYAKYTAVTTTGTINTLISGSIPWTADSAGTTQRIPAVFFTDQAGSQPTNLSVNVVYWIQYSTANENFGVFAAATGGAAIDIASGAAGNQYFNTFFPVGTHAATYGDHTLMTFTPQRLNLPYGEISKRIAEVGNTIIVGAISNILYPWNQIDALPSNIITLPEANTQELLTVNQMVYVFAGHKGNVYITDANVASLVIKVPDYCAGLDGTPSSYNEPRFTWGGAMYLRGRVYFSILDQTSTKSGNCGGVWSFYPTQNLYSGQDTGLALRLENQNSYGSYNGVATILIPYYDQNLISPQYWSGWYSSTSSATYGIDFTDTGPSSNAVIETDLAPVGTVLNKTTYKQVEYKLSAPLTDGEAVTIKWRKNGTDAYATMGTAITEGSTALSGYFQVNFQGIQWLQLEITLTPVTGSSSSLVRLRQVRVR